jgi:GAF domain-containing protein
MHTDTTMLMRMARISAEFVVDANGPEAVARSIASKTIDFLPGCDAAVVTVRDRARLFVAAATDPEAEECVALGHRLNAGPTVTAVWHAEGSVVESTEHDIRWPEWAHGALSVGIESVLARRLAVGGERLGALTVLGHAPREWSAHEIGLASAFATHASFALRSAQLADTVRVSLDARHRIGIAQGILMQRYGVGKDAAFSLLQRYSNATNIKVRDLAVQVGDRGDLPPLPTSEAG